MFNAMGQLMVAKIGIASFNGSTYGTGQLVRHNGTVYMANQTNVSTAPPGGGWDQIDWLTKLLDSDASYPGALLNDSTPGILVYDDAALKADGQATSDDTYRSNWLKKNGTLLIVNAFTGNVVR